MGSKRSKCLSRWRRGFGRAVVFLVATALLATGCGGGGGDSTTESEKAADAEALNGVLAQELTAIAAYGRGLPLLRGAMLTAAGEFRGQDQAHVDALTKAIRGLGGEVDAEASELESPGPRTRADALVLAYEEENAALSAAQDAVPGLYTEAPRALAAALATDHAQHLVVLRQGLGAGLAASVPEAFESGDLPPPTVPADGAQP
jgi:hypothetical protein